MACFHELVERRTLIMAGLVLFTLISRALTDPVSKMLMKGHFPDSIPHFEVRRDEKGNAVSRGQIYKKLYGPETTGDVEEKQERRTRRLLSYQEFAAALQCSPNQPDLHHSSGSLHMMHWVKPTLQTLETTAAYIETR